MKSYWVLSILVLSFLISCADKPVVKTVAEEYTGPWSWTDNRARDAQPHETRLPSMNDEDLKVSIEGEALPTPTPMYRSPQTGRDIRYSAESFYEYSGSKTAKKSKK